MATKCVISLGAVFAQALFAFVAINGTYTTFAQTSRVPVYRGLENGHNRFVADEAPTGNYCYLVPTLHCMGATTEDRYKNINTFFGSANNYSYFQQIKSIYNGASSSTTISADIATLNFSGGWQATFGTNIQAGSSGVASVATGTVPTLSATAAAQATQNMLYGGTVYGSALFPLISVGAPSLSSPGGFGFTVNFVGREGVDIQNFKAGTSTDTTAPPSHTGVLLEGYLQYNSINLVPNTANYQGSVFIGGSYGYSYTSHGYAR